jgi:mannose-6-phosphate isomerase-like protein (cupin superfamily)
LSASAPPILVLRYRSQEFAVDVFETSTTPTKIETSYGETIYELAGRTVGSKTTKHSVAYVTIAPRKSTLRHFHRQTEESYYLMAGEAFMEVGDESRPLKAGQLVLIPSMQPHKIYNTGSDDLVLLVACAPAWEASDVVWLETEPVAT